MVEKKRYFLTESELDDFFLAKYGTPDSVGWSPRRRYEFGYFTAGDRYEKLVDKLVDEHTRWVDVGGGRALLPNNEPLSRALSVRCARLVAVDPSSNVRENPYCHECVELPFENFCTAEKFDLATLRMVAEHVDDPEALVCKLSEVVSPEGLVVVYTINLYSPVPIATRFLPFWIHFPIKKLFWGGEPEDTFPVAYKMNTQKQLTDLFARRGFVLDHFERLDDLSVFANYKLMNYVELSLWKFLGRIGMKYPEHNLLAVFRKS